MDNWQKRAADAEQKRKIRNGTMADYKILEWENRRIAAQNKGKKLGESRKPNTAKAAKELAEKATSKAKDVFGATPCQQDDLLFANQMSLGEKP